MDVVKMCLGKCVQSMIAGGFQYFVNHQAVKEVRQGLDDVQLLLAWTFAMPEQS